MELDLTVTSALFDVVGDDEGSGDVRVRVMATGSGLVNRAVPIVAWVGDTPVKGLSPLPDGGGFVGHLEEVPPAGAELKVAWSGGEPIDTGVTFDAAPNV